MAGTQEPPDEGAQESRPAGSEPAPVVPSRQADQTPATRISQVVPLRGPAAGGTSLRILGTGFTTLTSVRVGETQVPSFHFISDGEVQIVTPPGAPGDATVVVTVAGHDIRGPDHPFQYIAAPVITSAKETRKGWIEIEGSDLTPVLSATIGGRAASGIDAHAIPLRIRRSTGPTGDMAIVIASDGGSSAPFTISFKAGWSRVFVFWLATTYFAMLVALLVTYMLIPGFNNNLPAQLGPLPIVIPWTGALGAVTLSLSGVIYHTAHRDWDSNYLMWHIARPSLGAAFASIAYFIIAGGVLASGGTPNAQTTPVQTAAPSPSSAVSAATTSTSATTTNATTTRTVATAVPAANPLAVSTTATTTSASSTGTPSSTDTQNAGSPAKSGGLQNLFYIVAAFIIGYREQTFRQMIEKVADLILGPGNKDDSGGGPSSSGGAGGGTRKPAQPGSSGTRTS